MRIISGNFKGKKLFLPNDKNTRPLKDLVKESIFNLISHSKKIDLDIQDSTVLDLFSGTGSFGIECLSRKAKKVIFFENYKDVIKILEKNLNLIKNKNSYLIFKEDCFKFLNSENMIDSCFDIVFIDPPYKETKINEILEIIYKRKILSPKGVIIVHRHKKDNLELYNKINFFEERIYGNSKIFFGNIKLF